MNPKKILNNTAFFAQQPCLAIRGREGNFLRTVSDLILPIGGSARPYKVYRQRKWWGLALGWKHPKGRKSRRLAWTHQQREKSTQMCPWRNCWRFLAGHQHSEQEDVKDDVEKLRRRVLCQPGTCVRTESSSKI